MRKSAGIGREIMNKPLRWIAACLVAAVLLSVRPTLQAVAWISLKSGIQAGRDFLCLFGEFPLVTLYLLRWDFLLAVFPAVPAVALSWGVGRNLGAKIIYSSIAVYFAASIIDVLHPVKVNPPIRTWFLLLSNLLLCPLFAAVIAYLSNWFGQGARPSKRSTL